MDVENIQGELIKKQTEIISMQSKVIDRYAWIIKMLVIIIITMIISATLVSAYYLYQTYSYSMEQETNQVEQTLKQKIN